MSMFNDPVVEIFSYTEQEQETFPYLRWYMRRIEPRMATVLSDPAKRERFMLAGLFLSYRAANHLGVNMTTDGDGSDTVNRRLSEYHRLTGHRIVDTRSYLKMIRFSPLKCLLMGPGRFLYNFVIYG